MLFPAVPDRAAAVTQGHVRGSGRDQESGNGGCRGTGAVQDNAHLTQLLPYQLQRVGKSRQGDDGGPVLVVMKDGNIGACLQALFDLKAARRRDILQVYPAKGLGDQADRLHDLVHVFAVNTDRHRVHIAEGLEEGAFSFHDRHAGLRADVPQAENRRSVGDDRHHVPATCQFIAFSRVLLDLQAGRRDARGIRQAQRLGGIHRCADRDLDLSLPFGVFFQ